MAKKKNNPRIPRKKGQHQNSPNHSDLFTDENEEGTIPGLKFATAKDAEASVNKIKKSGKSHNHKTQAAIAMEQRAKTMGKKSSASVFRKFIEDQKEITKERNKKKRKNEAIANKKNLFLDRPSTHEKYEKPVNDQIYDYLKDMGLVESHLREYIKEVIKNVLLEKKRDYKAEYARWGSSKKARKNNNARKRNRYQFEKEGKVKPGDGKEIDHKVPLCKGGSNKRSNLRVVSKSTNRKKARK